MKQLITILFLFCFIGSYGQTFVQRTSGSITPVDQRLKAGLTFYIPVAGDTTLNGGLDSLGAFVYVKTHQAVYYRDTIIGVGKKWTRLLKLGDVTPTFANNGLSKSGDTIQLGGAFVKNTLWTSSDPNYRLTFNGVSTFAEGPLLEVATSGSVGIAISGTSTDGRGLLGQATTGVGVYGAATGIGGYGLFGLSQDGNAMYLQSNTGMALEAVIIPPSTNTVIPMATWSRSSSVTGANGLGASFDFNLRTSTVDRLANQLIWKYTNATDASRTSSWEFWNVNNATIGRTLEIAGNGQLTLYGYPSLTQQTDTINIKPLGFNISTGSLEPMAYWVGGGIPSLTSTQIAFGSGTNTITSEAALNYDATINRLNADSLKTIFNRGDSAAYGPRYNYVLDSIWYSGTSITAGSGPSSNRQRFTTITSNRLDALESNNGISGGSMWIHGIAQIPFIPTYSASKYRWMVLEWIVNDIQLGVTDTATAAAAYLRYIDTCLARGWPAQKILILSPSYIDPSIFTNATLLRQSDFRTMVQDVAARRNTLHLDIWGIQVSRGGTLLLIDGIHPSDYGSSGGWSEPIIKKLGNTVRAKGQELQVNGLAEIQRLRLRTADTLTYKAVPVGMDSTGTLAPYQKDAIILNSALTPGPQSANINLTGRAYFGNVTSPTTPEIVQVTGMVKATSLRATGTSPNGLTGNGVEIFMNGSNGGIISYNRDAASGLVLSLNGVGGGQVVVNDLVSSGGPEKLYVNGNAKFGVGQFTSALPGGMTGSGMELGRISSTVGYIGAYNRDATSALNLSFMPLGGNTYFKSLSDNGSGLDFQFNGKTNFTDTARLNERFSYSSNIHGTFTLHSLVCKDYVDSLVAAGIGGDTTALYLPLVSYAGVGSDPDTLGIAGLKTLGTAGQSIRINAGGTGFEYYTPSSGGVTTMANIGSTPNADGASISGATLTLQPASGSFGGVVTTGTQTFAGDKSLTGTTTISNATLIINGGSAKLQINDQSGGEELNITNINQGLLFNARQDDFSFRDIIRFELEGPADGFQYLNSGTLILAGLDTDGSPPATTGTLRALVSDGNGKISFSATAFGGIYGGSGTLLTGTTTVSGTGSSDLIFGGGDGITTIGLNPTSYTTINNGLRYEVRAITADATAAISDHVITIDCTSGNVTLTLPAASASFASNMGNTFIIKRIDSSGNTCTISRAGSDTIDGATTTTLSALQAKNITANSTSTWIIH